MTREERLKACELRLDGLTWDQIGAELHYEGQSVYRDVKRAVFGPEKTKTEIPYPLLKKLIDEKCKGSVFELSIQLNYTAWLCRYYCLGIKEPSDKFLEACEQFFGVSRKELFSKDVLL